MRVLHPGIRIPSGKFPKPLSEHTRSFRITAPKLSIANTRTTVTVLLHDVSLLLVREQSILQRWGENNDTARWVAEKLAQKDGHVEKVRDDRKVALSSEPILGAYNARLAGRIGRHPQSERVKLHSRMDERQMTKSLVNGTDSKKRLGRFSSQNKKLPNSQNAAQSHQTPTLINYKYFEISVSKL